MLTALVARETLLLVLLTALVAGLLRSHAELLRRLGPEEPNASLAATPVSGATLPSVPERPSDPAATDVAGTTPAGDALKLSLRSGGAPTLLAFLTSGCATCRPFWEAWRDGRGNPLHNGIASSWSLRTAIARSRPGCASSQAPG